MSGESQRPADGISLPITSLFATLTGRLAQLLSPASALIHPAKGDR
jgi:hypothetical protein